MGNPERTTNGNDTKSASFRQTATDAATTTAASAADPSSAGHRVKRMLQRAGHRNVGVLARAVRRDMEAALDTNGWCWNPGISRWLDLLVVLEERSGR